MASQRQNQNQKRTRNPFYVLLVLAAVLFFITACAYGVMTVKQLHAGPATVLSEADRSFVQLLDRYGLAAMMGELAWLALLTFAAIGTDNYWARRAAADSADSAAETPAIAPTSKVPQGE